MRIKLKKLAALAFVCSNLQLPLKLNDRNGMGSSIKKGSVPFDNAAFLNSNEI
jgi:hypothetical protein